MFVRAFATVFLGSWPWLGAAPYRFWPRWVRRLRLRVPAADRVHRALPLDRVRDELVRHPPDGAAPDDDVRRNSIFSKIGRYVVVKTAPSAVLTTTPLFIEKLQERDGMGFLRIEISGEGSQSSPYFPKQSPN